LYNNSRRVQARETNKALIKHDLIGWLAEMVPSDPGAIAVGAGEKDYITLASYFASGDYSSAAYMINRTANASEVWDLTEDALAIIPYTSEHKGYEEIVADTNLIDQLINSGLAQEKALELTGGIMFWLLSQYRGTDAEVLARCFALSCEGDFAVAASVGAIGAYEYLYDGNLNFADRFNNCDRKKVAAKMLLTTRTDPNNCFVPFISIVDHFIVTLGGVPRLRDLFLGTEDQDKALLESI